MKRLILAVIALSTLLSSCSTGDIKIRPEHKGVDPAVQYLVDEYMWLSAQNNMSFTKEVSIGFKEMSEPTVGMCTWGGWFREIDIDPKYWNAIGKINRLALLFHELSHCYCGRAHDYGTRIAYPASSEARLKEFIEWMAKGGDRPGYWDDTCPTSILYPSVVEDECVKKHYQEYTTEMFNRCKPW